MSVNQATSFSVSHGSLSSLELPCPITDPNLSILIHLHTNVTSGKFILWLYGYAPHILKDEILSLIFVLDISVVHFCKFQAKA